MKTMEDIRRQGMEALARELGPVGMARFLSLFENGTGDYVQERHDRHDLEESRTRVRASDNGNTAPHT